MPVPSLQERQRASAGAAGVLGSVAGALLRKQAPAGSAGGPTASGPVAKRAADGRSKSPVDSGGERRAHLTSPCITKPLELLLVGHRAVQGVWDLSHTWLDGMSA